MAKIKLGALISDIRGTLQNGVYSLAKGGVHYVKNIPASVTNPNSADQQVIRQTLQFAAGAWYDALSPFERSSWEDLAQILSGMSKDNGGGIRNLVPAVGMDGSGFNAWCAFYTRSIAAGLTPTGVAPLAETPPVPPTGFSVDYVSPTMSITFVEPAVMDAGAWVAVWLVSHQKLFHKQIIGYHPGNFPMVYDLTGARGANGQTLSFSTVEPCKVLMQLQTINPSGWASPGGETIEVDID